MTESTMPGQSSSVANAMPFFKVVSKPPLLGAALIGCVFVRSAQILLNVALATPPRI